MTFCSFQLDRDEDGNYTASGSANIILYVGLGMISIGLVITFVGLGDKGFRTLELKLIGAYLKYLQSMYPIRNIDYLNNYFLFKNRSEFSGMWTFLCVTQSAILYSTFLLSSLL